MDRLVYVAMTGAKQALRQQAVIAHNLANASTDGFRADLARFAPRPIEGPGFASRINTVTEAEGFDGAAGTLMSTGEPLDLAIQGEGWFVVQAPDGSEALTRAGALKVSSVGLLQTQSGELVLGGNGPLSIPNNTDIVVGNDGTVSIVPLGQGPETLSQVDKLRLVNPALDRLVKRPDGLFQLADGTVPEADPNVRVASGYLETSNVNLAETLVGMIELARQFEMQVRMMQTADDNAARSTELLRVG